MLLTVALSAQSLKNNLCQKWKIDFEVLISNLPEERQQLMAMLSDEEKEEFKNQMKDMFDNNFIQFHKDGTLTSYDVQKGDNTGFWEFINNNTAIKTVTRRENKERILQIIELTRSRMVVRDEANIKMPQMTFIPVEN